MDSSSFTRYLSALPLLWRLPTVKDRTLSLVNSAHVTQILPAAILWDMDGTIVDTEPYWMSEQAALVRSFGLEWSIEDSLSLIGSGLDNSAAVLQSRGVDLEADAIVQLMTSRVLERIADKVEWRPGARDLMVAARAATIPMALVTMSHRRMALHVASLLQKDAPGAALFSVVVAGDDVTHSKPHPEPYLKAAELLGVDVSLCVAIEDSNTGLAAAVASGARSIGVPMHSELVDGLGYTIWPTLTGRTVADLCALIESEVAV